MNTSERERWPSPIQHRAGRLLRVNGRWSLTHLWEAGIDELKTACGLTYDASEIYDGEEDVEVFMPVESPDELTSCGDCFPGATGQVLVEKHRK